MRYVVAVAEERSFTRAAERCFVVQSALSHQIKALERELGVTLFARTNRRVEPTAAGEAFLIAARAGLDAAEHVGRVVPELSRSYFYGHATSVGHSRGRHGGLRRRDLGLAPGGSGGPVR